MPSSIKAIWLTMNPNLGASARSLQDWVLLGKDAGLSISVVIQKDGDLKKWLEETRVPHLLDPMYWPDRKRILLSVLHAWKLKRWMKKHHVQLIHCYEHDLYPFAVLLRQMTSCPLLCHVHFSLDRAFSSWAFGGPRKQPDALIWTSHQQQSDCAGVLAGLVPPSKEHVVPLGLDISRFGSHTEQREELRRSLDIAPDEVVIGAACALRARKRVDDFLELVRLLQARDSRVVGLLAGGEVSGDEAYAREIIPKIRALEETGRFRWLGNLEPVEPLMQATDIFVSTSEYETFGMSVLEAMACGKPVVAYRGGSVQEVLADTGLGAETGDLPTLVSLAQSLIADGDRRNILGTAARRRVAEEYNPHKSLKQLKQIYDSLV